MKKIYLAGPDVFLPDPLDVGRRKKDLCRQFGMEGLFPIDTQDDISNDAAAIFRANCSLMAQADIGVFNLTPFRGPGLDAGTAFEVGFMFSQGKPLFGYTDSTEAYSKRAADSHGPTSRDKGYLSDADGYMIEEFHLVDNLMIARAIEDSGGVVVTPKAGEDSLAAFGAFQDCLRIIAQSLG